MDDKGGIPQDADFFATIPAYARYYAIPYEQTRRGIRRIGRQAAVHQRAAEQACQIDYRCRRRMITVLMGDRSNLAAFHNGTPQATSDGFSESDGIVSSTGAGAIDTAIVFQLFAAKKSCAYIEDLVSRESGFLALAGAGHTLIDILTRQDEKACFAREVYAYQLLKAIGSLTAILGGVDAVVFTGEARQELKDLALELSGQMRFLGLDCRSCVIGDEVGLLTHDSSLVSAYYLECPSQVSRT